MHVNFHFLFFLFFSLFLLHSLCLSQPTELELLVQIKASLDPQGLYLTTWDPTATTDPCGSFEGVACNEEGRVANISLQGKGLYGQVPAAVGGLKSLTGLYLHFNSLTGVVPKEIAELSLLSDLYLNVNNLSGPVPPQISSMSNLQVLQLCYNKLNGSIPTQLGSLKKLSVLALQYNQLTGAIPASLGGLKQLTMLDLSFNNLFGPIPVKLADAPMLQALDIRNNSLSGNVPQAMMRLKAGFRYDNNDGLCGVGFSNLQMCNASANANLGRPEPFKPNGLQKDIPESANLPSGCSQTGCSNSSKRPQLGVIFGVAGCLVIFSVTGLFVFSWYRRQKQKIGSAFDASDDRLSTDQVKGDCRKCASPLVNLEYSSGWDPLAAAWSGSTFSQEFLEGYNYNLEDVERATQCFSDMNFLGKSNFCTTYKGILRDGSLVAIKCITKTSCKSDEAEFLEGLKILTSLKHDNLVKLRGFCFSKGRGKCFLFYDFVPHGSLVQFLDTIEGGSKILEWSTRVSIISGIAKGIGYLHGIKRKDSGLVHQNISAEKILIDGSNNPLLTDSCLHKLLADDVVFSMLKASAARGCLAPEYITTGRFTAKSDVYAFGMIILQILSGKHSISQSTREAAESCRFEEFIDASLVGNFSHLEASKLLRIAVLCCHDLPDLRPTMDMVLQELGELILSTP